MRAVKRNIIFFICFTAFFGCNSGQVTDENSVVNSNIVQTQDSIVYQDSTKVIDTIVNTKEVKITKPKDYTAKYICPSRCPNSGSDKMGDCPTCGMELIENPNSKKVIKKENTK